jgi:hypothetical protein
MGLAMSVAIRPPATRTGSMQHTYPCADCTTGRAGGVTADPVAAAPAGSVRVRAKLPEMNNNLKEPKNSVVIIWPGTAIKRNRVSIFVTMAPNLTEPGFCPINGPKQKSDAVCSTG